ncbi:MAG: hypothetical protein WCS42_15395 [Verrucomicrobiota bacterium]
MDKPRIGIVDYKSILELYQDCSKNQLIVHLQERLPFYFRDAYAEMTRRQTDIVRVRYNTFEYFYDHFPELQSHPTPPADLKIEPRLVGVLGCSSPQKIRRDDYRLKGWVGPTEKFFGRLWDKGHFIAHSVGGAVDGTEINVFIQKRSLNRGWSDEGKRFRQMERFCAMNPGTFCFSRPMYFDQTAKPVFVEFGVLKTSKHLWVECFDNS